MLVWIVWIGEKVAGWAVGQALSILLWHTSMGKKLKSRLRGWWKKVKNWRQSRWK